MPTIEIVSIGASLIPEFPQFDGFAYIVELGVTSHRGLFQDVLDKENGIIVHLAEKELEEHKDGFWFAGSLMKWEEESIEDDPVVFETHIFPDVVNLIKRMLELSPINEVIFLTDYQFGPEEREINKKAFSLSAFINMHETRALRYNALYRIKK